MSCRADDRDAACADAAVTSGFGSGPPNSNEATSAVTKIGETMGDLACGLR